MTRFSTIDGRCVIGYCEIVKNVTVSLDETTYRRARLRAAEAGRSLSALVREFLQTIGSTETDFERLHRQEKDLRERITGFSASPLLAREELHERRT